MLIVFCYLFLFIYLYTETFARCECEITIGECGFALGECESTWGDCGSRKGSMRIYYRGERIHKWVLRNRSYIVNVRVLGLPGQHANSNDSAVVGK